jgi:hypothetical protein
MSGLDSMSATLIVAALALEAAGTYRPAEVLLKQLIEDARRRVEILD